MSLAIAICAAQIPFVRGGAEVLYESLAAELRRRGHRVEIVSLPFNWRTRASLLRSALAWRMVDLEEVAGQRIDVVIATRFPSYLVRHPRKVVWLIHQFRQVYDLAATRFSDFGAQAGDARVAAMIRAMDRRSLGEARARFAISRNVAERLRRYNDLDAETLYPPPLLGERYRSGPFGDTVVTAGRLDPMKRFDLLVRAVAASSTPVRAVIAGTGPEAAPLARLAGELGVADRIELPGRISDERLVELYEGALAVYYAPFDEDYGYVTVEAFRSGRPVVTCADAGGVLEFVEDGRTGLVAKEASPRDLANRIDTLFRDRELAARLGAAGRERVRGVGWDPVIASLLGE